MAADATVPTPPASPLTDSQYEVLASQVLARIEAAVDGWLQDDVIDIDAQRTGGLLELSLPGAGGKLVVNTQPPLHELWLAARSGGYHFRWVEGRWLDTKDGREFHAVLSQALTAQSGTRLELAP